MRFGKTDFKKMMITKILTRSLYKLRIKILASKIMRNASIKVKIADVGKRPR
jgi:hypothetical protein